MEYICHQLLQETVIITYIFNLIRLQKLPSHERTAKLIDLVMTRTATGFRKFVDVLEVTGHHFLSDCLREAGTSKNILRVAAILFCSQLAFDEEITHILALPSRHTA